MRTTLIAAALAAAVALPIAAQAQVARVTGTVTQTHTGVALSCFVVAGSWYAIPTQNGTGFAAQSDAMLLAAADGHMISFIPDPTAPFLCGGGQPAVQAKDIDQTYP